MTSKTPVMDAEGAAIHAALAYGQIPLPGIGLEHLEPWDHHAARIGQGGSDNHPSLAALVDYARGGTAGRLYLLERGKVEISKWLELMEFGSGTYGPLHVGPWAGAAVLAGRDGDEELGRIARAIVQRQVVIRSMMSTITPSGVACFTPGQRFDFGTTTSLRLLEGEMVAVDLGLKPTWDRAERPDPPGVAILRGLRSVGSLSLLMSSELLEDCRQMLANKGHQPGPEFLAVLRSIRLASPVTWWRVGGGFAAMTDGGTHGQDPPALGVYVPGRESWTYLYPPEVRDRDPEEEGWSARAKFEPEDGDLVRLTGKWHRRDRDYTDTLVFYPLDDPIHIGNGPAWEYEGRDLPQFVPFPPATKVGPPPSPTPPPKPKPPELRPIKKIATLETVEKLSARTVLAAVSALLASTERARDPVPDARLVRAAKRTRRELEAIAGDPKKEKP